jgi:hypothetical protein
VASSFTRTATRLTLALPLVLPLCGCGLADYEAKMIDAQKRAQRLEEEARNLDEPLNMPTKKEKTGDVEVEVPVADVFLRPPRGIGPTPDKNPVNSLIYRYGPRTAAPTVPGTPASSAKSFADIVAVGLAFGNNRPDFTKEVLNAFQPAGQVTRANREVHHPDRPAVSVLEALEFDDARFSYSVYVGQGGTTQVAVVYWITKGHRSAVSTPLTFSLESLALGFDTFAARQAYARQVLGPGFPRR